jgi:hypothetical protein
MFNGFSSFDYYDLQNALYDGEVVKIFGNEWDAMLHRKPVVASKAIARDIPEEDLRTMWNLFLELRNRATPVHNGLLLSIPYAERDVWIAEQSEAITIMYHDEY